MLNLVLKVAVTGGIASGKSSVCRFLKEFGAYLVSADQIVHKLLSPTTSLGKQIIDLLGKDVLQDNQFNRQAIAEKVFKDYNLLKNLEDILHPEVQKEIEKEYTAFLSRLQNHPNVFQPDRKKALFVVEVPLLYESGFERDYDMTIFVMADLDICQKRFESSHTFRPGEFNQRTARLIHPEEKMRKADRIIHNNGTLEELKVATKQLYVELIT